MSVYHFLSATPLQCTNPGNSDISCGQVANEVSHSLLQCTDPGNPDKNQLQARPAVDFDVQRWSHKWLVGYNSPVSYKWNPPISDSWVHTHSNKNMEPMD